MTHWNGKRVIMEYSTMQYQLSFKINHRLWQGKLDNSLALEDET